MRVTFRSAALTIEGELAANAAATRGAVVCHPHPQYGGDMDNPVVLAVASALSASGNSTLRFNFRGVGASDGSYANGIGEAEDLRAAVRFLCEHTGVRCVTVAGYSFGALVALQATPTIAEADRLIAVAPPLSFAGVEPVAAWTNEKLFIVGDRDQYCSVAQLVDALATVVEPKQHTIITGADHFFAGYTGAVVDSVRSFSANVAAVR